MENDVTKMRIPVFDANGKRTEAILEVDDKVFGGEVRDVVLKEAILMYEARQRLGTHSTKTRGQTSGSGRKLWRQKGTGRARVGPARAPHWRGGGKVFTPHPRDYSYAIPKKARLVALNSAWLAKFRDREVLVVEDFAVTEPKTSKVATLLKTLGIQEQRTLVGVTEVNENLWKSVRNIEKVTYDLISRFSPYHLLRNHRILISKKGLESLVTSRGGSVKSLKRSDLYPKTNKAKK